MIFCNYFKYYTGTNVELYYESIELERNIKLQILINSNYYEKNISF